jgi:hypothetical protein
MPRAFLSHDTVDKSIVEIVALQLSRVRVVYDKQSFVLGTRLVDTIRSGLDTADLFVLFASKALIASTWVNLEVNEAEARLIDGRLSSLLVVLLDADIQVRDLPAWMQQIVAVRQRRSTAIARLIMSKLIELTEVTHKPLSFGREQLLSDAAQVIIPFNASRPPPSTALILRTGRSRQKNLGQTCIQNNLSTTAGPVFILSQNAGLDQFYLKFLEETRGWMIELL